MTSEVRPFLLSELPPHAWHRSLAALIALGSALVFAALLPFAKTPLGALPEFIAAYQSALVVVDVITATLIFSQYAVSRSSALAALGAGYIFSALMAFLHALTFPGLFAPMGLLGAGEQTTAWMYILWHAGFPLFVVAYASLQRRSVVVLPSLLASAIAVAAALGATVLTTVGHDVLPRIMQGNRYTEATIWALGATWFFSALGAAILWLRRPHSVLDLWLMVTMVAWICDIGLSAVFNGGRFDLGFYAGRVYGLLALSFLLVVFLSEYGILYSKSVQHDAAAASEARFRTMADAMPQLAWMARPDGHIDWYNRRWHEYMGTTPGQMEGWGWQSVHDPVVLPQVLERWKRSLDTGEQFEMVFPLKGADGVFRPFLTRVSPVKDDAGKVLHWFGTNTDITAQREAEDALRRADRRKDEFIATLAHELRNPLAPIRNAVEIMRLRARDIAEPLVLARDIIDRQSRHLARLVDDLLELSRITRGKLEVHKARVALQPAIEAALEATRPLAAQAGHELGAEMPREPLYVDADSTHLTQVFLNLLSNAVKFTPRGGRITLELERRGSEALVVVRDTGVGIPREHLPRLFEMFSQVTPALDRTQGGLGIGLALVRGLLELHAGSVHARSDGPDQGSEFEVRLPLAAAPEEGETRAHAPPGSSSRRVLVADDNRDAALTLRRLLEALGHEVMETHDGVEAVEAVRTFKPQIVLLDIGMPRMNGYEAAREIRRQPDGRGLRVVAVTGWGQQEDKRRAHEAGFDLHLTKPIDLAALESVLRQ